MKYVAKDSNGEVWEYSHKPKKYKNFCGAKFMCSKEWHRAHKLTVEEAHHHYADLKPGACRKIEVEND